MDQLTLPAPDAAARTLAVPSVLLGTIDVPADAVYTFPLGLYAYESARHFALVPTGREGVWWLQSLEDAALVFLLADPFLQRPEYEADLPDGDLASLSASGAPGELAILAIVTLPPDRGGTPTANFRAPVVLNLHMRLGRQLVLQGERWGLTEEVGLA
jgi:flagellar assembly factor FliW